MAIQTLTAIPAKFTAGDTVLFTESFADFPATGWDLTLWLSLNGGTPSSIEATASGTDFLVTISKTASAALAPGRYQYALVATTETQTATAKEGTLDVLPNFSTAQAVSTTAAILAALETAILALASGTNQTVNFSGQTVTKKDLPQLLEQRTLLRAELAAEQARLNRLRGGADSGRIVTRFVNP